MDTNGQSQPLQQATAVVQNGVPEMPQTQSIQTPTHSMKKLLLLFGILEILFPSLALYMLLPLLNLQKTLGTNFISPFLGIAFFVVALLVALAQIAVAVFSLDLKLSKQKTKGLFILGLVLAVLTIPAIILFIINPIYSNISTIN